MKKSLIALAVLFAFQSHMAVADDVATDGAVTATQATDTAAGKPSKENKTAKKAKAGKDSKTAKKTKADRKHHSKDHGKSEDHEKSDDHGKSEGKSNAGGDERGLERSGDMSGRDKSEQGKPEKD